MDGLHGLDLPLLVALQTLLREASVSAAARRLETTQPSMSRALARLRTVFGNPLLRPVGRAMELTPFARQLAPRVDRALAAVRELTAPNSESRPEHEERVVTIAASDYALAVILQPWLAKMRKQAPGLQLRVVPISPSAVVPLALGELDFAIGPRLPLEGVAQFVFRELLTDELVCVVRRNHPRARRALTLHEYLALEHVMIGNDRTNISAVELALHKLGKTRRVAAAVPAFLSAVEMIADSDLAATLPRKLVKRWPLRLRTLPFSVAAQTLHLIWHPRRNSDGWHRWLRDRLLS